MIYFFLATSPIIALNKKPSLEDIMGLLKDNSAGWDDIGRWLQVPLNKCKELRVHIGLSNEGRLEEVINHWLESECLEPVTWAKLIEVLKNNDLVNTAKKIEAHLGSTDS